MRACCAAWHATHVGCTSNATSLPRTLSATGTRTRTSSDVWSAAHAGTARRAEHRSPLSAGESQAPFGTRSSRLVRCAACQLRGCALYAPAATAGGWRGGEALPGGAWHSFYGERSRSPAGLSLCSDCMHTARPPPFHSPHVTFSPSACGQQSGQAWSGRGTSVKGGAERCRGCITGHCGTAGAEPTQA